MYPCDSVNVSAHPSSFGETSHSGYVGVADYVRKTNLSQPKSLYDKNDTKLLVERDFLAYSSPASSELGSAFNIFLSDVKKGLEERVNDVKKHTHALETVFKETLHNFRKETATNIHIEALSDKVQSLDQSLELFKDYAGDSFGKVSVECNKNISKQQYDHLAQLVQQDVSSFLDSFDVTRRLKASMKAPTNNTLLNEDEIKNLANHSWEYLEARIQNISSRLNEHIQSMEYAGSESSAGALSSGRTMFSGMSKINDLANPFSNTSNTRDLAHTTQTQQAASVSEMLQHLAETTHDIKADLAPLEAKNTHFSKEIIEIIEDKIQSRVSAVAKVYDEKLGNLLSQVETATLVLQESAEEAQELQQQHQEAMNVKNTSIENMTELMEERFNASLGMLNEKIDFVSFENEELKQRENEYLLRISWLEERVMALEYSSFLTAAAATTGPHSPLQGGRPLSKPSPAPSVLDRYFQDCQKFQGIHRLNTADVSSSAYGVGADTKFKDFPAASLVSGPWQMHYEEESENVSISTEAQELIGRLRLQYARISEEGEDADFYDMRPRGSLPISHDGSGSNSDSESEADGSALVKRRDASTTGPVILGQHDGTPRRRARIREMLLADGSSTSEVDDSSNDYSTSCCSSCCDSIESAGDTQGDTENEYSCSGSETENEEEGGSKGSGFGSDAQSDNDKGDDSGDWDYDDDGCEGSGFGNSDGESPVGSDRIRTRPGSRESEAESIDSEFQRTLKKIDEAQEELDKVMDRIYDYALEACGESREDQGMANAGAKETADICGCDFTSPWSAGMDGAHEEAGSGNWAAKAEAPIPKEELSIARMNSMHYRDCMLNLLKAKDKPLFDEGAVARRGRTVTPFKEQIPDEEDENCVGPEVLEYAAAPAGFYSREEFSSRYYEMDLYQGLFDTRVNAAGSGGSHEDGGGAEFDQGSIYKHLGMRKGELCHNVGWKFGESFQD